MPDIERDDVLGTVRCSSTWVKPPVDAPTSMQRRPSTRSPRGPNASSAASSLYAALLTHVWPLPLTLRS